MQWSAQQKKPHTHTKRAQTQTDTDATHMDSDAQVHVRTRRSSSYRMMAQRENQPHARHPLHVQPCPPSLPPHFSPQTPCRLHHAQIRLQAPPSLDECVSVSSMHARELGSHQHTDPAGPAALTAR